MEREKMEREMAAALSIDTAPVETQYRVLSEGLQHQLADLRARPLTQTTRAIAVELDTRAKKFNDQLEATRTELKRPILEAGRKLDTFFARIAAPGKEVRSQCSSIIAQIDAEERRKRCEQAMREAAEALRIAEERRKAEAEALAAQAVATGDETLLQAAIDVEQAPVEPVIVTPEKYVPAGNGYSTREVKTGQVADLYKLLCWMVESRERVESMHSDLFGPIRQARLDAALSRGVKFPEDAVKVGVKAVTRNASRE